MEAGLVQVLDCLSRSQDLLKDHGFAKLSAEIERQFDVAYCEYVASLDDIFLAQSKVYFSNFPAVWAKRYHSLHSRGEHPLISIARGRARPIEWENQESGQAVQTMLAEARLLHLGDRCVSLPLRGPHRYLGVFTVSFRKVRVTWKHFQTRQLPFVWYAASHFHESVRRSVVTATSQTARLSNREKDCIYWAAMGKTAGETAIILGISESTVRLYLEKARIKLGCTNKTQLVGQAVGSDLLSDYQPDPKSSQDTAC